MTDNGGERRNSGAGDSWFKPSENRYRTQSEYQDPLEGEETGESQETVFPDSGGYTGLSSSRPAMVEPYPEALGGPPPSNGISYPGAGASAYQPLTRVPGEPEEPSFPSVAASARVPLPEEEREDSRPDEPQTQEIPALDSWDPSGGADAAPEGSDEHDDTDSGPSAWSTPGPAADQPWDGGARTWEGEAPAVVPGDGAVGGQPWDDDAPDAWSSPAPGTPGPDAAGDRPWHSGDAGRYGEDTAETHTPDAGDPGVAWGAPSAPASEGAGTSGPEAFGGQPWDDGPASWDAPSAPASEGAGASGPEALGGQPWDDGPASWDAPSPGPGEADGAAPWNDTAGGRSWDGDELGSPAWDADAPAADTDRAGANTWGAGTGAPGDRPWEDGHRAQDAPGPGTADPDAAWDAPSFAPGPVDGPGAEAVDDRPWDIREQASSAWEGDGADEVGPPAWGGEAAGADAARGFAEQGAEAPAGGRPWGGDELGSSTWSADAPVGGADRPGADAWGTTAGTDGSLASGPPGAPGPEAFGGQPRDDGPGARPASDPGFPGVGAQGERSWDADDPLGTDAPGGRTWGEDPLGGSEPRGRSWSPDAPLGSDVPGERSWDADDPLGTGAQGKRSWGEDPLGADAPGERSWNTDELGAGSWGADGSAAGTDGLDSWTPSRENGDGWAGSGTNEPWTDGRGDELSPPDPSAGSGNTWVFGRDDPRMPDVVREAERRRRESAAGSGTPGGADPDTGELSAAVPASEDPLAAIADMQTRARSRDEEPGDATRMFDVPEEDWEDRRDPAGYGRTWEDGEAGYDDGPDGYGYEDGPDGYDAGPAEHGYDAAPDGAGYVDGPGDPEYDGGTDDPEYDDGFTPADYGMPEAAVGRRRRRDPIAGDFPGFDDRPLGGDPGDPYPGYDNIDFLADTERGAVLTLWLGVASLLPGVGLATALVALLVTGPKAKKEIRESRGQLDGLGLITTGTVFAVLGILVTVISVAVWLVL